MPSPQETAAAVALLRLARRPPRVYADLIDDAGSALAVLEHELAGDDAGQASLFAPSATELLAQAAPEIERWREEGIDLLTILGSEYPQNLRAAHDRPPLIFVAGALIPRDHHSLAVIGSRRASPDGIAMAKRVAEHLVESGYTVVSGLAAGVDSAAHTAALDAGGRTLAVLGTGLNRTYPPQNTDLQQRIINECAAISSFWPDAPPTRQSFPARNAVMSAMALATVIVEATVTSGARIQARQSLAQGRPVFLLSSLLNQTWARELAARPGTYVIDSPPQITSAMARLHDPGALVA
ncbi:MAG: DNA-processing protein DprA [Solirubrobacteraceae bacterium]